MDDEAALKAEIAKLSGAIQSHKHQSSYVPPARARAAYRGASYRGSRGAYPSTAVSQRNRTLVLNRNAASSQPASKASAEEQKFAEGWVKRKSTHNLSLLSASTFEKTEPARLAALAATQKARQAAQTSASSSDAPTSSAYKGKSKASSSSVRRGDNMGEVVIDGVVFEFDPSGTKLIKKASQPLSASTVSDTEGNTAAPSAIPLKTHINGQNYVRTKRGNLISADLLAKRRAQKESVAKIHRLNTMVGQISDIQATRYSTSRSRPPSNLSTKKADRAKTLCAFFNKTGQCKRGLSCPYVHDITKIALCPKLLRPSGCTLPQGTCPLSHTPKPQRVPHCVHYLRSGECRNGIACTYTHSDKLPNGLDTKFCNDFGKYGWCDRGENCTERHTYECPDFAERGKCDRKGCKLLHVIRAHPNQNPSTLRDANSTSDLDDVQDGDLFMRDDAAAAQLTDEEDDTLSTQNVTKRKRPLNDSVLDANEAGGDADVALTFAQNGTGRRKKAKAFVQQNDFISFDDDVDEDDHDALDEHESAQHTSSDHEDDDDDDDNESVHSEEFESGNEDNDSSDNDRIDRNL